MKPLGIIGKKNPPKGGFAGRSSGGSMPPATASSRASRRLGRFRFRTVSLFEPSAPLKAEGGRRNHLLHASAALGALVGRWIGEFLAKLELVVTVLTFILINRHFYIPPFCAVLHNLSHSTFNINSMTPVCQYLRAATRKDLAGRFTSNLYNLATYII
jgi:hypothetical protein